MQAALLQSTNVVRVLNQDVSEIGLSRFALLGSLTIGLRAVQSTALVKMRFAYLL